MTCLSRSSEGRARSIVREARTHPSPDELVRTTCQDIARHLSTIDATHRTSQRLHRSILDDECKLGADLTRLRRQQPSYSEAEAALRDRRQSLEKEKRQLLAKETETAQEQATQLLALLQRYDQLQPLE